MPSITTDVLTAVALGGMAVTGLVGSVTRRARRALRSTVDELAEVRRRLSESQRLAELGSWELDQKTDTLSWSEETFRIFEINPKKFGASYDAFLALVHPDDRTRVNRVYTSSISAGVPYEIVHRLCMADGRIKTLRERGVTHYDQETSRPLRTIGTVQDISREIALKEDFERERGFAAGSPKAAPAIVLLTDTAGRILHANNVLEDLTGYRQEDLKGKDWLTVLVPAEQGSGLRAHLASARGEGPNRPYVATIVSRAGRPIEIEWYHHVLEDQNEVQTGLLSIGLEVSGRERLDEARRASESRLRNVLDAFPDWILVCDLDGRILEVNRAAAKPFNRAADQFIGIKLWDFPWATVSAERRARVRLAVQAAARGETVRGDFAVHTSPENTRMVRGSISPVRDAGDVAYLVAFGTDITERGRMESEVATLNQGPQSRLERLRESEERFARLFRSNPIAIGLRRLRDDVMLDVNPAFEALVGRSREHLVGRHMDDLDLYYDPRDRREIFERVARGDRLNDYEVRFKSATGEPRPVLMTGEYMLLGGEPCVIACLIDITQRVHTETARKALEAQLHEARKMEALGAFASGIVHDFNNILTVISGNTEVALRDTPPVAETRRSLELIQLASRRGTELVRRISAFAKGQQQPACSIDLTAIIKDICALLQPSIGDAMDFQVEIEPDLPRVLCDEGQIHQILGNLVTNAVHALATGPGRIVVSLRARRLAEPFKGRVATISPGSYVVLSVTDTGPGIDSLMQSRIFEPFFTTKPASLGTGLGLAVVEGIVRSRGGHVTLESVVGTGSTFYVWLPTALSSTPVTIGQATFETTGVSKARRRVIHIDDDRAFAEHIGTVLRNHGFLVKTLGSAQDGLEYVRHNPQALDLLITDYRMPGMSGLDLASEVSRLNPSLPILILTGAGDERLTRAIDAAEPAFTVIYKSEDTALLLELVERLLS